MPQDPELAAFRQRLVGVDTQQAPAPNQGETGRIAESVYKTNPTQQDQSLTRVLVKSRQNPNQKVGGRTAAERMDSIRHNTNTDLGTSAENTGSGNTFIRGAGKVLNNTGMNLYDLWHRSQNRGRSSGVEHLGNAVDDYYQSSQKAHPGYHVPGVSNLIGPVGPGTAGEAVGYALPAALMGPASTGSRLAQMGGDAVAGWLGSNPGDASVDRTMMAAGGAVGGQVARGVGKYAAGTKLGQSISSGAGRLSKAASHYMPDWLSSDLSPQPQPKQITAGSHKMPGRPMNDEFRVDTGNYQDWPMGDGPHSDVIPGQPGIDGTATVAEKTIPGSPEPFQDLAPDQMFDDIGIRNQGMDQMVNEPSPFSEIPDRNIPINAEPIGPSAFSEIAPDQMKPMAQDQVSTLKGVVADIQQKHLARKSAYDSVADDLIKDVDPGFHDQARSMIHKQLQMIEEAKSPAARDKAGQLLVTNLEKMKASKPPGGRGEVPAAGPKTQEEMAFKMSAELAPQRRELFPQASEVPPVVQEHSLDDAINQVGDYRTQEDWPIQDAEGPLAPSNDLIANKRNRQKLRLGQSFENPTAPRDSYGHRQDPFQMEHSPLPSVHDTQPIQPSVYDTQPVKKTRSKPGGPKLSEIEGKKKTVYPGPDKSGKNPTIHRPGGIKVSEDPTPELTAAGERAGDWKLSGEDRHNVARVGIEVMREGHAKDPISWQREVNNRTDGIYTPRQLEDIWNELKTDRSPQHTITPIGTQEGFGKIPAQKLYNIHGHPDFPDGTTLTEQTLRDHGLIE